MRRRILALGILALFALAAQPALAKRKPVPDGTLELSEGSVAVGIGWSWGGGTLTWRGKRHPVTVEGLSVGAVGASRVSARGSVYNLRRLEDFDGTYAAVGAGATAGGGMGVQALKNQNGVRINLHSTSRGLKLTAGAQGVTLRLKK